MKNIRFNFMFLALLMVISINVIACKNTVFISKIQMQNDDMYTILSELEQDSTKKTNLICVKLDHNDTIPAQIIEPYETNSSTIIIGGSEPQYIGGMIAMSEFINQNINKTLIESVFCMELKQTVYIQFTINEEGEVEDANIAKGCCSQIIDNESLRLVLLMPKWISAEYNEKKISVKYTLPLHFYLN